MTKEEREHIDFKTYQENRRHMCWAAMVMMLVATAVTLYDPARVEAAESILLRTEERRAGQEGSAGGGLE